MQSVEAKVRWEWISEAWKMFTEQWQNWVVMTLVYIAAFAIPIILLYLFMGAIIASMPAPNSDVQPKFPAFLLLLLPVFYAAILLLSAWLTSGLYRAGFKQLHGGRISVGDLFSGGPYVLRVLGAVLLIGILTFIGIVLCIIPGIIIGGMLFFTIPLIVEGNLGVIDALKTSFETTKKDWLMFTLFAIVLSFLASAGTYACGVGLLATFPLLFLTHAVAYRDCIGIAGARSYAPSFPPPPPNYGAPSMSSYSPPQPPPNYGAPQPPPNYGAPPPPPVYDAPPQPPPPPTRFCTNCGAEVRSISKFCPTCGTNMPE